MPSPPAAGSLQPALAVATPPRPNRTEWKGWPSEEQQCDEQGCWPRLFVIGAQKGATSSLFNVLHGEGIACGTMMNSAVTQAMPSAGGGIPGGAAALATAAGGLVKEAHMLDMAKPDWRTLVARPELYRSLYRVADCPQRTFLDATPKYIRHPGVPGRLVALMPAAWLPQLRVVLSIREPIARDLSWFNHKSAALGRLPKTASRAPMVRQFCSLSEGSSWGEYPRYEDEVKCRKQELSNCLNGAGVQRLDKGSNASQSYDASLPEDYSECVEATWHNQISRSDPTSSEWDDESSPWLLPSGELAGNDPPLLAFGMYQPQIRAWSRRLHRSQILVLDFDRLVARPDDMLPRVTSFMGLPALQKNELPHENEQPYARKVDVISCFAADLLSDVYRTANDDLVRLMRADHERGHAPSQEPLFEGFTTTVPCQEQEHVWLAEQEQEA